MRTQGKGKGKGKSGRNKAKVKSEMTTKEIVNNKNERKILSYLKKLWNSITALRIITTIGLVGTLITIVTFAYDLYTTRKEKLALQYVSNNAPYVQNDEKLYKVNLDRLSKNIEYNDAYNFYSALYLSYFDNKANGGYVKVNEYLKRINSNSPYYNRSIILEIQNIYRYITPPTSTEMISSVLLRLEQYGNLCPEYFFFKTILLVQKKEIS